MTYIEKISMAVVDVLKNACDGQPNRFAGYAAQRGGFWIGEAKHCLDVIRGYDARFKNYMLRAADPTVERTTDYEDRSSAKRSVLEEAKRMLVRCEKLQLSSPSILPNWAHQIGIQTPL